MTAFTKTVLNYPQGADTPIHRVTVNRAPTTADRRNFSLGDEWLNTTSNDWWKLAANPISGAVWVRIGGVPGDVASLTGDSGGAVLPDASNNINVLGTSGQIVVTGNPGTNTLTWSLANGGTPMDSFVPDAGTNPVVPTAAGAVTMVGGNGILTTGGLNTLTFDMQSPFTGDFTFQNTAASTSNNFLVRNLDTNAVSISRVGISVVAGSAADPFLVIAQEATDNYCLGIDNSDSDKLKINYDTAAVDPSTGNNLWNMTKTGIRQMPLQPLFRASLAATSLNVTGDGTVYTIPFNTEDYDQGSNFNTATGTFTAPVQGIYLFVVNMSLEDLAAANTQGTVNIASTTGAQVIHNSNVGAIRDAANRLLISGSSIALLAAGGTATVTVAVMGGAAVVDVVGGLNQTTFAGFLLA